MVDEASLYAALKQFGICEFRGQQRECILAILNKEDTFVLWPTGAGFDYLPYMNVQSTSIIYQTYILLGKSLVYQLPPVLTKSLSIVVSPLLSLMFDQVDHLRSLGINADVICSAKTRVQNAKVCLLLQNTASWFFIPLE